MRIEGEHTVEYSPERLSLQPTEEERVTEHANVVLELTPEEHIHERAPVEDLVIYIPPEVVAQISHFACYQCEKPYDGNDSPICGCTGPLPLGYVKRLIT